MSPHACLAIFEGRTSAGGHHDGCLRQLHSAETGKTALVVATRGAERQTSPGRSNAPLSSTETEACQGGTAARFSPRLVSRHSVEQTIENFVPAQILDVLVPPVVKDGVQDRIMQQLMEQILMDDTEQEIEAPKISCQDRHPLRAVLLVAQMAEQLVEVPLVSPVGLRSQCSCAADG